MGVEAERGEGWLCVGSSDGRRVCVGRMWGGKEKGESLGVHLRCSLCVNVCKGKGVWAHEHSL